MAKNKEKALFSHLMIVMQHIIKWIIQPMKRSGSWIASIKEGRRAIAKLLKHSPSLKRLIAGMWHRAFEKGK